MKPLKLMLMTLICMTFISCGRQTDYSSYLDHMPKSILVLPPLNSSVEAEASNKFLSTVSRPLGERGYYVFPIAVVDNMMKENGLLSPNDMHQVPLKKIDEIFGADAVLYITIDDWGQSYQILSTQTTVAISYRLVDVKTGMTLWVQSGRAVKGSGGGNDIIADLIVAVVTKIVDDAMEVDHSRPLAIQVNHGIFNNRNHGLLLGQRHPKFTEDQQKHITQRLEREKE